MMIKDSATWLGGKFFLEKCLWWCARIAVFGVVLGPLVLVGVMVTLFLGLSALWIPTWLLCRFVQGVGIADMFNDQGEPLVRTWVILSVVISPFVIAIVYAISFVSLQFLWSLGQKLWRFRTPKRILARVRSEGDRILTEREAERIRAEAARRKWWEERLRQNQIEQDEKDRQIALKHNREKEIREQGGSARYPQDADDFEEVAASFARRAGFPDARRTPKGPDGGIDVVAKEMVGQAKFHPSQKVSPIDIRALAGSRQEAGVKYAMFFHYGPGYSAECLKVAAKLNVLLYELVPPGRFQRVR